MPQFLFPKTLKGFSLLYILLASLCLVSITYFDRDLSSLMHAHSLNREWFKLFSYTPVLLELMAALVIIACIVKQFRANYLYLAIALLVTLMLAFIVRLTAKFIFGRTWPESWITLPTGHNPSWIADGIEAFHPFAHGLSYNSFPSGHALFTSALALTFWRQFPKLWPLWTGLMLIAVAGQLGMNYHFLGDLIAGVSFGLLVSHCAMLLTAKIAWQPQQNR
ncbi:phosphatase PAP2 family protein [Shewanella colwelliana]|uniref:phosphatase PAP2 family protein n=1 Tax=Shewanella colwelliana TaxID=23 RepID=UPI00373588E2